ncbi:alpha/beta fold hydrolase [Amycolatopsis coloradensis]|uniref:Alpha/beta fold hydrolase n=1 Tax=Amycolatopsis coloradensis TaxID=76021 RepID=A0ACD5BFR6_9PSEU
MAGPEDVPHRGFGLSTPEPGYRYWPEEHADVVTGFLDALGIEGTTLAGQDWGGLIGLAAAQRRPGAFDRLVLANTWAWPRAASWSGGSTSSSTPSSPPATDGGNPPRPR